MRIDIISAVPELLYSPLNFSIIKRAQDKGKIEIFTHDLRDYAYDKHKQIDDKPFGGGAGMMLKPEPFFHCIEKLIAERPYDEVVFMTPRGETLSQKTANALSIKNNLLILAGHYKGVDERVIEQFVTKEISIGAYVLSGGELPALVLTDAIVRLIPGVLGDSESALNDSFQDDDSIEAPYYTRPADYRGMKVPEVLLNGNFGKIEEWKKSQSEVLTKKWKKNNSLE
jgi:tRNA (guanine37-N1)-methyltransferase